MRLSPAELDKLVLHQAGVLAQKRLARGLRLNHPEAVALSGTVLLALNAGRSTHTLTVSNVGDRPIQVGSHFPFHETNSALLRPGQHPWVSARCARGHCGALRTRRVQIDSLGGLRGEPSMSVRITRAQSAAMYGPTTGDRLRLAVRLNLVGPLRAQAVLRSLRGVMERALSACVRLRGDDAASVSPWLEGASGVHHKLYSRLFQS